MINVLENLEKAATSRKTQTEADLKAGKTISAEEEEWLDHSNSVNLVDEERVVEVLDNLNKSDYERGLRHNVASGDNDDASILVKPPPSYHKAGQNYDQEVH